MESECKTIHIKYEPFKSETLIFISTSYAVVSLILGGIVFRFFLSQGNEVFAIKTHAFFSLVFLIYIGFQTKHRSELNKLPSPDVIKLCYLVKQLSNDGEEGFSGGWSTTCDTFNKYSMKRLFGEEISQIIPPHDYFSFMVAERYIDIHSVTDNGSDINKNLLSICLSEKALSRLAIHEKTSSW